MKNWNKTTTPASEQDSAQTPQWFIDSLCDFIGIEKFHLDVCATQDTTKAFDFYDENDNGLQREWLRLNFCNPPYSKGNVEKWTEKTKVETECGFDTRTAMLIPDKPEVGYVRFVHTFADTIIHMPFRLKFLKPDGSEFLDKEGKPQSPKFPVMVAWFTGLGLKSETRHMYHDFRKGFLEGH